MMHHLRHRGTRSWLRVKSGGREPFARCPLIPCAVTRRRFPVGESPTRQPLQPEATGAAMEVTKWLKPSDSGTRITVLLSQKVAGIGTPAQSYRLTLRIASWSERNSGFRWLLKKKGGKNQINST